MSAPARIVALLTTAVVPLVGLAAPALADSPSTWDDAPARSTLDTLVLFGGSTLGLIALITLFALLTARNNYVPPPPSAEVEVAGEPPL
jgi:hypothetical protein